MHIGAAGEQPQRTTGVRVTLDGVANDGHRYRLLRDRRRGPPELPRDRLPLIPGEAEGEAPLLAGSLRFPRGVPAVAAARWVRPRWNHRRGWTREIRTVTARTSGAKRRHTTAAKLVGTAGVLGVAATIAGLSTFGGFTDSTTPVDTRVDSAVLSIDVAGAGDSLSM